ncbi:PKD-like family lipoprotein [Chitinophaga solisilvae]|uniref:Uncharacterized protein n=1 Tax=Chitinophaga solisilvae TaxID=1233460 RepID=A0A433WJB3_9BACT|nr:PKD-like family lipoprotein [Chitinophaga solisilvae]NSL88855.1 hypothetical protein [Chitinophaga solisilvae]
MKRNHLKLLMAAFFVCLLHTSCYKDLGNYDYHEINSMDSVTNIKGEYLMLFKDTLRINPKLFPTMDKDVKKRYSFRWEALVDGVTRIPGDSSLYLVGTGRNLEYPVALRPAAYDMFYRVKDEETGVEWLYRFKLKVQSAVYTGWLVLCNVNGMSRLDMISVLGDSSRVINDVLSFTNAGIPPQPSPRQIVFAYRSNGDQIYLNSAAGINRLDGEGLGWKSTYNIRYEMLVPVPVEYKPDYFYNTPKYPGIDYLIEGDRVYFQNIMYGMKGFGVRINRVDEEKDFFQPAPFIAGGNDAANLYVLYDKTQRRFVTHNALANNCSSLADGTLFSYKTGRELVFMSNTNYNGGDIFAIMKDNAGKYYTYCFRVTRNGVAQSYYTEMTDATDIGQAATFAVSNQLGYIFYAAGGKLYEYDVFTKKSFVMADLGDKKVSVLKTFDFGFGRFKEPYITIGRQLIVGAYDPSQPDDVNGTLYRYNIPARNEPLVLDKSFTGLGKPADIAYRER